MIHFSLFLVLLAMSFQAYAEPPNNAYAPSVSIERSFTKIRVETDGSSEKLIEHSWRIETEKGVSNFGEATISYSTSNESIEIIEAFITQPDGTKIVIGPDDIYDKADDIGEGTAAFSDTHYKVIVYPQVNVGSRLTYKAKLKQHTPDYPGHFYYYEAFSPAYRYAHEETIFEFSKALPIKIDHRQGELVKLDDQDGYTLYRYFYTQNTATPSEAGQVAYADYAPYIMATSFADHAALGRAYQQRAKPMAAVTPDIQNLANEITDGIDNPKEQVRALYDWVAGNIRYVFIGLGDGGFVPQPADLVLKNRYGDCKGHVVLLEALLAAKGIESSPALINSGNAYTLPPVAVAYPFNHVITYVPSLDLYLDSTARMTPFGYLPASTMDKPVVLTALNKIDRTPILTANDHTMKSEVKMSVLQDGSIEGTSTTTSTGWLEENQREIHHSEMHAQHMIVQNRLEYYLEAGKGQIKILPPNGEQKSFTEQTSFKIEPSLNIPGPGAMKIPAAPLPYSLRDYSLIMPLVNSTTPINCFSRTIIEDYTLELPDSVRIRHIPKSLKYQNQLARYEAQYTKHGKTIRTTRKMQLNYPDFVCDQADKKLIAELIDVMRRDLRSQVVYE